MGGNFASLNPCPKKWADLGSGECARFGRPAILAGALLIVSVPLFAQSGHLRVSVADPTGAPLSYATVSVWGSGENIVAQDETDSSGEVVLTGLPFGDFQISIIKGGFAKYFRTVTILDESEQTVEATLRVESAFVDKVPIEAVRVVQSEPAYMPSGEALDLPSPKTNPSKHHWWQIFR